MLDKLPLTTSVTAFLKIHHKTNVNSSLIVQVLGQYIAIKSEMLLSPRSNSINGGNGPCVYKTITREGENYLGQPVQGDRYPIITHRSIKTVCKAKQIIHVKLYGAQFLGGYTSYPDNPTKGLLIQKVRSEGNESS